MQTYEVERLERMEFEDSGATASLVIEFVASTGEAIELLFPRSQLDEFVSAMLDVQARLSADLPQ